MSNLLHSAVAFTASVVASPLGNFLFSSGKNYLENKKKNAIKIQCIVIPAGSGKSQLVQKFTDEFGLNSDVVMLDLEESVIKSPLVNAEAKSQLELLKYTNPLQYQLHLFPIAKEIMGATLQHMIDIKSEKILVVLVSSIELKRALQLTNSFYFAPAVKLYQTIVASRPEVKIALDYSRAVLDQSDKAIQIFTSWECLYEMVLEAIGIKRTIA